MIRPQLAGPIGSFVARVILAAAILLVTSSRPARADSPAEALFQEGRRLLLAGQTDEACSRFTESYAMVASSGTLLNLALCHQTQGKTATAWNEYRAAARLARNQGREDRASVADDKARALEAKLARVTTNAVEAAPGLRVATEAGALGEGALGADVPIDPGTHQVIVTAPGHLPWTTTLEVKEGDQLTVDIPRLEAQLLPQAPAPVGLTASGGDDGPSAPRRSSLSLYLGGGGAVAVVAGTVIWSVAYAKLQSAKEVCTVGCTESDRDARISEIGTLKDIAVAAWIVGGGLAVASGVTYLLHRRTAAATVTIDPIHAGVLLRGSF